ncbi:MAG: GNAT family N-acetyltransferase [Phenylobacterium sp.]|uniref:GNAT family N-acetyltransferase n=1 Tax=Phenylobacterium sp. TaxID=1871053 RepID=UPI0025F84A2B|nr:GNAT family N-acetyltransferase [Phenylobacterium sp.]MCA3709685.1 GNAT family N-acetyltransferase [Phenylobacterium sp.]
MEQAYRPYVAALGYEPAPLRADYGDLLRTGVTRILETPEGEMMGLVVFFEEPGCLLVDNVALFPKWQRRGVLVEVFVQGVAEARRRGFRYVRCFTNEKLKRNILFYQKLGFEISHREDLGDRVAIHLRLDTESLSERGIGGWLLARRVGA